MTVFMLKVYNNVCTNGVLKIVKVILGSEKVRESLPEARLNLRKVSVVQAGEVWSHAFTALKHGTIRVHKQLAHLALLFFCRTIVQFFHVGIRLIEGGEIHSPVVGIGDLGANNFITTACVSFVLNLEVFTCDLAHFLTVFIIKILY